jgi:hypothetical protein
MTRDLKMRKMGLPDGYIMAAKGHRLGCRDGLFSFEAEKLGAREVNGIHNDLSAGAVPDFRETQMKYTGGPGDTGSGST